MDLTSFLESNPDGPALTTEELKALAENDELQAHQDARVWWVKQKQDNVEFAGMLEATDESLGRIRKKLKDLGLADNTIVIFTADNGGMSASNQYRGINHPIESLDSRFASSNLPCGERKAGTTRVVYACHWLFIGQGGSNLIPLLMPWLPERISIQLCSK